MQLNLSVNKTNEAERLILVSAIGLLESLENQVLTIDDCENYLFSPYTVSILEEKGVSEKVIEIVELGCELEDIQSLMPDRLKEEIHTLKLQAYECLRGVPLSDDPFDVKKWLDK
ncbi:DUF3969 family protein [uncultured Vagococcus sp.]|uniref:DUF3969 family protein n=1 Tax=uncultured Vagococcus sp. TaxID=189676 RepID=UPI0028D5D1E9|nr:DUF3969 family protein [uncultured Vagococcus sp.]